MQPLLLPTFLVSAGHGSRCLYRGAHQTLPVLALHIHPIRSLNSRTRSCSLINRSLLPQVRLLTMSSTRTSGQPSSSDKAPKKVPMIPRPSSSILLISPSNQILLLHRVQTSTAFASAHVFPGGNLSAQDGEVPAVDDPRCHEDGLAYRIGAIRECFEESGILLAKRNDGSGALLRIDEKEREAARKDIHSEKIKFTGWVEQNGGIVDTESLMPFTRWITPTNVPKRFTTQMYIYFLPIEKHQTTESTSREVKTESVIPIPTSDGGIEHTAALFAPCQTWLEQANRNEIILFPPQYYLISLLSPFLTSSTTGTSLSMLELQAQRDRVIEFLKTDGDGSGVLWADKVMSPTSLFLRKKDKRAVLGLDKPGPELANSSRKGDLERVVLVSFGKSGPRDVEVRRRQDVFDEERASSSDTKL